MQTLSIVKQPYEVSFSRNPIIFRFKVTPYSEADYAMGVAVVVNLFMETSHHSNEWLELKQLRLAPDENGFCNVDVANMLDANLYFEPPAPNDTSVSVCTKQAGRYYIKYALVNNNAQLVSPLETQRFHVYKGGMSIDAYHRSRFFESNIITDKQFLRFKPVGREYIGINEPMWFYYALYISSGNVAANTVVTITVTWDNAQVQQKSISINEELFNWQIICAPVGIKQLQLDAAPPAGATYIDYIEVRAARDTATLIADDVRLYVDYNNYYDTKKLHYFNSLGGFDTITLKGELEIGGDYQKQEITRLNSGTFSAQGVLEATNLQSNSFEKATVKGNTGWLPEWKILALRDLLRANVCYENTGNKLKPVVISSASVRLYSNKEKLYSIEVDYKDAFEEKNYSPASLISSINGCPEVEFFEVTQGSAPYYYRVAWQLPPGYNKLEVLELPTFTMPGTSPTGSVILNGNSGVAEVRTRFSNWVFNLPHQYTFYYFGRVLCDQYSTPPVGGSWEVTTATLYRYPAPLAFNDYAVTYRDTWNRQIIFPYGKVTGNDIGRNFSGVLRPILANSGVGTAGGFFSFSWPDNELWYQPPNSSFTGTDSIEYIVQEQVAAPKNWSEPATAKIFIIVESPEGNVVSAVYIRLRSKGSRFVATGSNTWTIKTDLYADFFNDPLAQQPLDVTNRGIVFQVQGSSNLGGPPAVGTSTGKGTSMYLGDFDIKKSTGEEFSYKILNGPNYLVL